MRLDLSPSEDDAEIQRNRFERFVKEKWTNKI